MSTERHTFRTGPAPVVTDEGAFGPLPPRADPRGHARRPRSRVRRATAQLALVGTVWLLVMSAAQISTPATALPALGRIVAALTDIDGLIALQTPAIRAAAARPGVTVIEVPGFPVKAATLTAEAARSGSPDQWRSTLLSASADAIYGHGMSAFAQEAEGSDGQPLSTPGNTALVIEALTASRHTFAVVLTLIVGIGVLALGARVALLGEDASRFVAIGLAMLGAAVLAAAATVVAAMFLLVAALFGSSQLADEVAAVARTLAWTPLWDALRLGVAGLVMTLISAAVAVWLGTRLEDADFTHDA